MWFKLRQKKKSSSRIAVNDQSLRICGMGEPGVLFFKKKAEKEERWGRDGEEGCSSAQGTRLIYVFFSWTRLLTFLQLSFKRRVAVDCRNRFWGKNSCTHPRSRGSLVFCLSVGVGNRSSCTLPPVGGAQQSQVAVGGTKALLRRRRRRRRLGSSQHLCVLKQVGKSRVRSSRSVFYCATGSRSFFTSRTPWVTLPPEVLHPRRQECVCVLVWAWINEHVETILTHSYLHVAISGCFLLR